MPLGRKHLRRNRDAPTGGMAFKEQRNKQQRNQAQARALFQSSFLSYRKSNAERFQRPICLHFNTLFDEVQVTKGLYK
jgi:hypothetical protein